MRDRADERRAEGGDEGPEDRVIPPGKSMSVTPSFAKPATGGEATCFPGRGKEIGDRETPRCVGTSAHRMQELVQFLFGFKGEGRRESCLVAPLSVPFAIPPTAGVHTSPASVVFVTFENPFGAMVLPVPEPRRIPAQASLIVLPVTKLLLPVDGGHESSV